MCQVERGAPQKKFSLFFLAMVVEKDYEIVRDRRCRKKFFPFVAGDHNPEERVMRVQRPLTDYLFVMVLVRGCVGFSGAVFPVHIAVQRWWYLGHLFALFQVIHNCG